MMRTAPLMPLIPHAPRPWPLIVCALLAGCAAGPDFKTPPAPQAMSYTSGKLPARTASTPGELGGAQQFIAGQTVAAMWWKAFASPKLDALVVQSLQHSPTLAAAQSTLRQARETYAAQSGSTLYPQVSATLGAQTLQNNSAAMGLPGGERRYDLYNAGVRCVMGIGIANV